MTYGNEQTPQYLPNLLGKDGFSLNEQQTVNTKSLIALSNRLQIAARSHYETWAWLVAAVYPTPHHPQVQQEGVCIHQPTFHLYKISAGADALQRGMPDPQHQKMFE